MQEKRKFYTDGVKTIKLRLTDPIPEGFWPGRTFNSKAWNKGLKATTDERVRLNHEHSVITRKKNNTYVSWNKGLTKETCESLKRVSEKVSTSRKGKTPWNKGVPMKEESKLKVSLKNKGKKAWNKGLTKETDARLIGTSEKQKGHRDYVVDKIAAKQKECETRKKHNCYNKSIFEDNYYNKLCLMYPNTTIVRQYFDKERYPFKCDFYIKEKDLFIELNGYWVHNSHPFDKNNPKDIEELNEWIQKAGTSKQYKHAIYMWTDLDVRKLNTFRKNKLNFKIIYKDITIEN